jgi:hypothetical protein
MDLQQIITWAGGLLIGTGVVWTAWRYIQPLLPANKDRDATIEKLIQTVNRLTEDPTAPDVISVPDRATALAYCEAILRHLEKKPDPKKGVDALIVVMSQIAAPAPKE